jgi:hypothetical protein
VGEEMRRAKSLRIGVHHADGVVWGPVYRTHLMANCGCAASPHFPLLILVGYASAR